MLEVSSCFVLKLYDTTELTHSKKCPRVDIEWTQSGLLTLTLTLKYIYILPLSHAKSAYVYLKYSKRDNLSQNVFGPLMDSTIQCNKSPAPLLSYSAALYSGFIPWLHPWFRLWTIRPWTFILCTVHLLRCRPSLQACVCPMFGCKSISLQTHWRPQKNSRLNVGVWNANEPRLAAVCV